MLEEMFVLIQRVLVAVCLTCFVGAAVIYVVAKHNAKKLTKISNVRNKTISKNTEKQKQTEKEQIKTKEIENTQKFSENVIIKKMQQDSLNAGLKQFKFGYFTADCLEDNWIKFVQKAANSGKLEDSKHTENSDNTIVYNKDDIAVLKMQGKGEEMNPLLQEAPLTAGSKIVEYYMQLNKTNKYVVENKVENKVENELQTRLLQENGTEPEK